jgi:hypothetical protein
MRDMRIVRRSAVALAATLTVAAGAAPAADACFFDINSHGSIVWIPPTPQRHVQFEARHRVVLAPMPEAGLRD